MAARVMFFGHGALGRYCMDSLIRADAEIVAVVPRYPINDDGLTIKGLADEIGVQTIETPDPNDQELLDVLGSLQPVYLISVQYDRIFGPPLLALPTLGALNLHNGPLPRLRGCFPTKWAIINDESAGVTIHWIDEDVDTGPIVAQREVELAADETDESLYRRLSREGAVLFDSIVGLIAAGEVPEGEPQDHDRATYHPKGLPNGGVIDWNRPAVEVARFIRAFTSPPYPGAKTGLADHILELTAPVWVAPGLGGPPGAVVLDDAIRISCADGSISVDHLTLNGELLTTNELREFEWPKARLGPPQA